MPGPIVEFWVIPHANIANMPSLLAGLRAAPIPHHIVVYDNSTNAVTAAALKTMMLDGETLIISPDNRMCFGASQTLLDMRITNAPFIGYLCSTHTKIVDPTWICDCIAVLSTVPHAGLAGYLLRIPGLFWFKAAFCGTRPTALKLPTHFPMLEDRWTREEIFERADTQIHVQGGLWVALRAALEESGGFERVIPHTFGDVELAVRMQMHGWALCGVDTVYSEHNAFMEPRDLTGFKIAHIYEKQERPAAPPPETPEEVYLPEKAVDTYHLGVRP